MCNRTKYKVFLACVLAILIAIFALKYNYYQDIHKGTLEIYSTVEENSNNGFIILANSNINVSNNNANILVQNSEYNKQNCRVKLFNGENLLYESDILYPGFYIEDATLFNNRINSNKDSKLVFEILNDNNDVNSIATIRVELKEEE